MISLNVQWIPVNDRSGTYQWSGSDDTSRKVKTVTFFGTGEMRGQQQAKVITPPGSDYTDAYLSAFASKPIPTRRVHRLSTSVFDTSAPIPLKPTSTPLTISSSMKTSQTRFVDTDNIQTSSTFDKPIPSPSDRSSTYSSSFVPERPTTYEPFSRTQYSSPQSQTFTSSYSALLRSPTSTITSIPSPSVDSQRSYTTLQSRSQPSPSATYPAIYRPEAGYESIYKPMPPYSIQAYPPSNTYTTSLSSSSTESTYKPYVPFQSFPLSSSYNINQSSTSDRVVLPPTTVEKQIDRPETLLFQHDEDIRSSRIKKPSPMFSPSPESPMTREELKVEPERLPTEELSATNSEPIKILENTLNKYDSLINQISEVLASVSPLSSTISTMSPGKSVLDYQLSSDSSPTLSHERIDSQLAEQPTTSAVKSGDIQRTKASHLIRDDSYDKIVIAMSDLDTEIISPSEIQQPPPSIKEEKEEEAKTSSVDESQAPSITGEEREETKPSQAEEQQVPSVSKEDKEEEVKIPSIPQEETKILSPDEHQALSVTKEEAGETKTISTEEQQGPSVTEEVKKEETQTIPIGEQQTTSIAEDIKEETKPTQAEEQQIPLVSKEEKEEELKTSATGESQTPSVTEEEKKEETQTPSIVEQQTTSTTEDIKEETKPTQAKEQQIPLVSKEEKEEEIKISATGESQSSSITEEEKKEETQTSSIVEQQTTLTTEDIKEETKIPSTDESQTPSVTEEGKKEETKDVSEGEHQVPLSIREEKEEETKTSVTDESQTPLITEDEKKEEATITSSDEHLVISSAEEKQEETVTPSIDEHQLSTTSEEEKVEIKTSLPEEHQISSVAEQEKEEPKIESSDKHQTPSVVQEETKISLPDEQQMPSIPEELPNLSAEPTSDTSVSEILQSSETKSDEEKVVDKQPTVKTTSETAEFIQQQTGLLTNVPDDVPVTEEVQEASVNVAPTKKAEKHVRWDETVVDSEDDESLSYQSSSEESSTPAASITTTYEDTSAAADESKTTIDQQLTSSDITAPQMTSDQITNLPTTMEPSIALSSTADHQVTLPDSSEFQTTSTEQQVSSSSHPEDQTNLPAATDEQIHKTDIIEKQMSPSDSTERQIRSPSPLETTSTFSDSTNQQIVSSDVTESQLNLDERQTHSISPTDTQSASTTDSSKEDTFTINEVSTTTSDVIGNEDISKPTEESEAIKTESKEEVTIDEHKVGTSSPVAESVPQESETSVIERTTASLQPTIVSPIDTLADTVANCYISSDVYHGYLGEHYQPLQDVSDVDHDSTTKSLIASLRETITAPITPLIETIQGVVSSMQTTHPSKTRSDATDHTEDETSLTTTVVTESIEKVSDDKTQVEENEPTMDTSEKLKTVFESLREAITAPITAITETIQNVVSPTETHTKDEEAIQEEKSDAQSLEHSAPADTVRDETVTSTESLPSEILELPSTVEKTEESTTESVELTPAVQHDEQVSTTTPATLEQANIPDKQELASSEISSEPLTEQKLDENAPTETKTTFEVIRDVITHPLATITEKIQSVISSSTTEEVPSSEQETTTDQNKGDDITSTVTESTIETTSDTIANPPTAVNETVEDVVSNTKDQTSISEEKEQILAAQGSEVYSQDQIQGEQALSSPTIPSQISDDENYGSISHKIDDATTTDANQLLVDTIRNLINDSINTVISNLNRNTIENEQSVPITETTTQQTTIKPQTDDIMQRSSNELESDSTSAITEIEKVPPKPSTEFREASPSNTEDDSLELIHALRGHSIIHPSSPVVQTQTTNNQPSTSTSTIAKADEQHLQGPEKSSSSTTSSQITSSDRYVSYAIHEMGDSSQERLPSFPLAADIPIYKLVETTSSNENKDQQILSEPIVNVNQNITKDDDLTELDATENLTSYSDDIHIQKLNTSAPKREENLDASSTDEDVDDENFNEFDQHDTLNLHRIIEDITQSHSISGDDGQTYQRYDLSNTSSTSTKAQTDDIYMIPGYPGLWRPSADDADDDTTRSSFANDADDEDEKKQSTTTVKTKTIVRTTDPAKLQSFLQQQHQDLTTQDIPLRPDTIDIFNRPLNEFTFDLSESDSFKTPPSTINSSSVSKQQKQSELFQSIPEQQEHQISPEEKIFLIRERERGISLPVTMKIDYDDMALRLSSSTPIDAQLFSTTQTDLPSPSTHSEPIQKTTSSSRASTPSLSGNESEQQKLPSSSWLNTVNTITTTTEGPDGPLESRTTIHKSAKGPISIAECDPQGKFLVIENTSRSKSIALGSWTIRQENDSGDILTFTFPDNCLLRPNHSLKILTKPNESERRNSDLIASLLSSWHTGSNIVTKLINADGKDRASLTKKTLFS